MKNVETILPIFPLEAGPKPAQKRFIGSLEYELIASLAMQQFVVDNQIQFDRLLAIPHADRLPGLVKEYGLKKAHRLVKLILQEFCNSIRLPKSAKLSDTKIAACACDLLLDACEHQLSIEDLVVFFEAAKQGDFGKIKGMLTHYSIMQKLELYRQERTSASIRAQQEAVLKKMNDLPRTSEPKSIGEILQQAEVITMTTRKSG